MQSEKGRNEGMGLWLVAAGPLAGLVAVLGIFGGFLLGVLLILGVLLAPLGIGIAAIAGWLGSSAERAAKARPASRTSEEAEGAPSSSASSLPYLKTFGEVGEVDLASAIHYIQHDGGVQPASTALRQVAATAAPYRTDLRAIACPENAVLGVMDDGGRADGALAALRAAGFAAQEITLRQAPQATSVMARAGWPNPWSLAMSYVRSTFTDREPMLEAYREQERAGRHVLHVAVSGRVETDQAAQILASHGAHSIRHFGQWVIRALAPTVTVEQGEEAHDMERAAGRVKAAEIAGADILQELSLEQLRKVLAISRYVEAPEGTQLAKEGEAGHAVYIVLEGQVQLTAWSSRGEITVRIAGPGESLPLAALLGRGRLITTAQAMTELRAVELPCAAFHELVRREPEIGMRVYQAIADILGGRYRNTMTRLVGTLEEALRGAEAFANM